MKRTSYFTTSLINRTLLVVFTILFCVFSGFSQRPVKKTIPKKPAATQQTTAKVVKATPVEIPQNKWENLPDGYWSTNMNTPGMFFGVGRLQKKGNRIIGVFITPTSYFITNKGWASAKEWCFEGDVKGIVVTLSKSFSYRPALEDGSEPEFIPTEFMNFPLSIKSDEEPAYLLSKGWAYTLTGSDPAEWFEIESLNRCVQYFGGESTLKNKFTKPVLQKAKDDLFQIDNTYFKKFENSVTGVLGMSNICFQGKISGTDVYITRAAQYQEKYNGSGVFSKVTELTEPQITGKKESIFSIKGVRSIYDNGIFRTNTDDITVIDSCIEYFQNNQQANTVTNKYNLSKISPKESRSNSSKKAQTNQTQDSSTQQKPEKETKKESKTKKALNDIWNRIKKP